MMLTINSVIPTGVGIDPTLRLGISSLFLTSRFTFSKEIASLRIPRAYAIEYDRAAAENARSRNR
jgi:hypothetical protein